MGKHVAIWGMGYLGLPLALALSEQGAEVRAQRRTQHAEDANLPLDVVVQDWSGDQVDNNEDNWTAWRAYQTWVCLWPPTITADYVEKMRNWVFQATRLGVTHLVYSSSTSVYGDAVEECNEHSACHPQTENARKIVEVERILRNSGIKNVDILRLGGLYSDDRHPVFILSKREVNYDGDMAVNMLHKQQAVAALAFAVNHPDDVRVRNLVQKNHPTKLEFYTQEAARLHLPVPHFAISIGEEHPGKTVLTAYTDFLPFCR